MENLLLRKLKIKDNFRVKLINSPANYREIIGETPKNIFANLHNSNTEAYDGFLIFAITKADLNAALDETRFQIQANTVCWIIYPKTKSKLASDLNMMQSWEDLTQYELTPCASAAIDETWTAIRIKPIDAQRKSGIGNSEIQSNEYGRYVDVKNKVVNLPEDLEAALQQLPEAFSFYQQLSYSNRKEYVLWILTAKQEKTRLDRIQKTIDKLLRNKKNPSDK
ncbi:MAG: hypothetical protein EOO90_07960 [Pedobacter sp.]|nr:MAG: hypothetical protein EOO90_07960 [Pedobacter sp.]